MSRGVKLIKKSNQLVNARLDFSVTEIRLFTLMVSFIKNDDENFKKYRIPIQEFIKTFRISNKNIYKEIEQTTDNLLKKIIKIPIEEDGQQKLFKTTLVNSFQYNLDGSGVIECTFHPDLKPHLLQLKNRFLLYDMNQVLHISSANSIRMYELLKAFEGLGKRTFEVANLKEILGVENKYGNNYYNFKKRVILQAQKDLKKHTDIHFNFEEIKRPWSKAIEKITFFICSNEGKKSLPERVIQLPQWAEELKKYELSTAIIQKHIVAVYDKDFVIQTLKYCKKHFSNGNIKNPSGYILKALEKGFYRELIEEKVQKSKKSVDLKKVNKVAEEKEKNREKALNERVLVLFDELSTAKAEECQSDFLEELRQSDLFRKLYQNRKMQHPMIKSRWLTFLKKRFLSKENQIID